jgi:hypothetical protein
MNDRWREVGDRKQPSFRLRENYVSWRVHGANTPPQALLDRNHKALASVLSPCPSLGYAWLTAHLAARK